MLDLEKNLSKLDRYYGDLHVTFGRDEILAHPDFLPGITTRLAFEVILEHDGWYGFSYGSYTALVE